MVNRTRVKGSPRPGNARRKPTFVTKIGDVFDQVTVISDAFTDGSQRFVWIRCSCGVTKPYKVNMLFRDRPGIVSCGCSRGMAKMITFNGETHTQSQWARKVGLEPSALSFRLRHGWTVERALTTPKITCR
jgi:hypothetical protein